ncbi:MAG: RNA-binding cell elongation regulator Jag/EloR [Christensenella sp.]|uniref:RNA-binding cell elongation regulator Jag/EloR n=1 Tax=Christensenella sp. TaxID=1935934 RepID=UPI002B1F6467|nr:RNA-binding cell elongation regulator Jag/EloR [Christensenella sp.]MEA5004367.1 RNA-binding cell elongation regulator Jag/EloR [Christensenella sp.]
MEAKGKTVDEAIFSGLEELGLALDEVNIDIVHEGSKGLFGIGKNAVVRLTKKEEEQPEAAAPQPQSSGKRNKSKRDSTTAVSESSKPRVNVTPGDSAPEKFLNGLFARMDVDAVGAVKQEGEKSIQIEITGADTAVLIGRRGDTLDALQYLTGLAVNKGKDDYKKIMLDAENYRQKREHTLEKLAKRLANTVAKTGKPITLEPMNPYERRILHATLQNNPRVETMSEGEEPYRRVVIRRKRSAD